MLLQLGFTVAPTLHTEIHGYPANLWWPWSILGLLIIFATGYRPNYRALLGADAQSEPTIYVIGFRNVVTGLLA